MAILFSLFLTAIAASTIQAQSAAVTTRYWDCCKPSCAWSGKANLLSPVRTCNAQDQPIANQDARSGCDGGDSFMCTNNGPLVINDQLAIGTAATAFSGQSESATCCACYAVTFTSTAAAGKTMIVQSINTGGDLGGAHFDLAIPGGGLGIFDGCSREFSTDTSKWGARYGGVSSASQCSALPASLQAGCNFRFSFLGGADNPSVTYKRVQCPANLVARTGCKRPDDASQPVFAMPGGTSPAPSSPAPVPSPAPQPAPAPQPVPAFPTTGCSPIYGQCGGNNWTGPKCCAAGSTCKLNNEWYSQCLPARRHRQRSM